MEAWIRVGKDGVYLERDSEEVQIRLRQNRSVCATHGVSECISSVCICSTHNVRPWPTFQRYQPFPRV